MVIDRDDVVDDKRPDEDWFAYFKRKAAERHEDLPASVFACDRCHDTGWAPDSQGRVTRCSCRPRRAYADDVPYEFQSATLATFDVEPGNTAAVTRAKAFLDGERDLYLCGGVGSGKTRLACTILNETYARGRQGWFVRVPLMLYHLQPGSGLSDPQRAEFETRLFQERLVVFDDVGAERDVATDFTRRMLLLIYETRGDTGLRTIWTSNLTPDDLSAMQGDDRLASRIAGRCDVVRLTTSDQRLVRRTRRDHE